VSDGPAIAHESRSRLFSVTHRTVTSIAGPLLVADHADHVGYGEIVDVITGAGETRRGQVLAVEGDRIVVQVLAGTRGLDIPNTSVRTRAEVARLGVGPGLLGRILDGSGRPLDGGPPPQADAYRDVNGLPLNPVVRRHPAEFIETGIAAIDVLNTLVRGQKLPIFSGFGLPAMELAAQIAAHARVHTPEPSEAEGFAVVFAAIGITDREASFFRHSLADSSALEHAVLFLNLADDPALERLLTPRAALTAAEYLAFDQGLHVLVILTDITHYCEALREASAARQEIPGRRGYPGYMYTDLASLFERAGRVHGRSGSITQLSILSMPDDDITHPIPDLTGYITEGQIVLSRDLDRRGVLPPIDILPSLSRLMNAGIGPGNTREDHRALADQLYASYAKAVDVRRLTAIIGEAALSESDRRYLEFAERLETTFVHQGGTGRSIDESLDLAWELLSEFPPEELRRIPAGLMARRGRPARSPQENAT
jgi:V/A-type H+-transporting ATPase subunit B